MHRTLLPSLPPDCPPQIAADFVNAPVYDSSCSDTAQVFFLDREEGFFLKRAPKSALREEAALTRFFGEAGCGPEVLSYVTADSDWLLTRRVPGEDGTHFLDRPAFLCDLLGSAFRNLHDSGPRLAAFSALPDRVAGIPEAAERGLECGVFREYLHPEEYGIASPEDARAVLLSGPVPFSADCLIHGDACLPNVMIVEDRFSGFVDCGGAGRGNRHTDLFWTLWSLRFNLKTDEWGGRFLDAYGRDAVDGDQLRFAAAAEAVCP